MEKSIFDTLTEIRKDRKITQEAVANHVGSSRITVNAWENQKKGKSQPTLEQAEKYADLLGLKLVLILNPDKQ